MILTRKRLFISLAIIISIFFTIQMTTAGAEQPRARLKASDNLIRISPNQPKIIHLKENAVSVIISNPTHATVILDTPRILIIIPREPGATAFTVLNAKGNIIIEKNILVSARANEHVRIRRICSGDDNSCVSQEVFYCPNGCYAVSTQSSGATSTSIPNIAPSAIASSLVPAGALEEEEAP